MKEDELVALAKKVLAADKVLHEQQLGLQWRGPNEEVRRFVWLQPVACGACQLVVACAWRCSACLRRRPTPCYMCRCQPLSAAQIAARLARASQAAPRCRCSGLHTRQRRRKQSGSAPQRRALEARWLQEPPLQMMVTRRALRMQREPKSCSGCDRTHGAQLPCYLWLPGAACIALHPLPCWRQGNAGQAAQALFESKKPCIQSGCTTASVCHCSRAQELPMCQHPLASNFAR